MNDREWTSLTDRVVAGDRLSPEETQRLEEAARVDPLRASELGMLDELGGFVDGRDAEPSADSIAIAHAALARVAAGEGVPRPSAAHDTSRKGRTSRRWTVGLAAASLAAAAVAVIAVSWPEREPSPGAQEVAGARLTIASGEVTIDGRSIGDALPRIASSTTLAIRDGRACLAIDPRIDVCLDGTTTASVEGLADAQARVDVHHGHAVARLDPLPSGRSFALEGVGLRAMAVGTIFSIDVSDDGASVTAAVLDGVVEVHAADTTLRLAAHEVVRVHAGQIERGRLSAQDEARDLDLLAAVPAVDGQIGHVAIEVSPAGATVLVDDRPLGTSPLVAALPVGEHRIELRGADGARLAETLTVQADTLVARRFALTRADEPEVEPEVAPEVAMDELMDPDAPASEPARPRAITRLSPRELLVEARTLRREDRWRDAAKVYRQLLREHPRSSEAHTALVSLGDLLLDRLGEPQQAARVYLRYVRAGGGALAPEARWGIIRARRKQGDLRGEREAIEDFLRYHPDDARAASLR